MESNESTTLWLVCQFSPFEKLTLHGLLPTKEAAAATAAAASIPHNGKYLIIPFYLTKEEEVAVMQKIVQTLKEHWDGK